MCKDSNIRVVVSKGGMRTCEVVPADTPIAEIVRLFLCCLGLVASPVEIHCAMKEISKGYCPQGVGVDDEPIAYWSDANGHWHGVYSDGDTNTEGEDD